MAEINQQATKDLYSQLQEIKKITEILSNENLKPDEKTLLQEKLDQQFDSYEKSYDIVHENINEYLENPRVIKVLKEADIDISILYHCLKTTVNFLDAANNLKNKTFSSKYPSLQDDSQKCKRDLNEFSRKMKIYIETQENKVNDLNREITTLEKILENKAINNDHRKKLQNKLVKLKQEKEIIEENIIIAKESINIAVILETGLAIAKAIFGAYLIFNSTSFLSTIGILMLVAGLADIGDVLPKVNAVFNPPKPSLNDQIESILEHPEVELGDYNTSDNYIGEPILINEKGVIMVTFERKDNLVKIHFYNAIEGILIVSLTADNLAIESDLSFSINEIKQVTAMEMDSEDDKKEQWYNLTVLLTNGKEKQLYIQFWPLVEIVENSEKSYRFLVFSNNE